MVRRYVDAVVRADLEAKMVFVAGPRQVGKTTLAKGILGDPVGYLNWDIPEHRQTILSRELPPVPIVAFDELHKYRSWRNYLKGLFDGAGAELRILVTGSARLDAYRRGGDSLQGRYHLHRLHPLSVAELGDPASLPDLLRLGGFPEPFFAGSERSARRWSREYRTLLVGEEIRSLEQIVDLGNVELLALRLPALVGAPLSLNALREDLGVSHDAVRRWVAALERLYALVRLSPFGAPAIRAIKKAQKHYLFDWTQVPEMPQRFENLVAMALLKWVHQQQDAEGRDLDLRYFRDVDGREVDFVVTERTVPVLLVEAKWSDSGVDRNLRYLKRRFPDAEAWQLSATGSKDVRTPEGIRLAPAATLLSGLA
ncbi:MAG: AAA family ATPase [Spirochaetaceae bacterium]|nr:AAA family ATPase [Spirochaetaceae bacterium]